MKRAISWALIAALQFVSVTAPANAFPVVAGVLAASPAGTGYAIPYAVQLDGTDHFTRTFGAPTDNKKWTLSLWVQRSTAGVAQTLWSTKIINEDQLNFQANNTIRFYVDGTASGWITTTAAFSSTSARYHIRVDYDSANAVAEDRAIIWVNGVRQTVTTGTTFVQNFNSAFNGNARYHALYAYRTSSGASPLTLFPGKAEETIFIDGQNPAQSAFGEFSGANWVPVDYAGTYGNNGFRLSNGTAGALGTDTSGNGNNWTANGTPTQVTGF